MAGGNGRGMGRGSAPSSGSLGRHLWAGPSWTFCRLWVIVTVGQLKRMLAG